MALEHLKVIEKHHNQTRFFNKPKGFLQDLFSIWQQTTEVTTSKEDALEKYKEATSLLKESATTFQNNDALLLLAELNLVGIQQKKKKLSMSHYPCLLFFIVIICSFQSMRILETINKLLCITMN